MCFVDSHTELMCGPAFENSIPESLNIYQVSQGWTTSPGSISTVVIAAKSIDDAKQYVPDSWQRSGKAIVTDSYLDSEWAPPEHLKVREIGKANPDIQEYELISIEFKGDVFEFKNNLIGTPVIALRNLYIDTPDGNSFLIAQQYEIGTIIRLKENSDFACILFDDQFHDFRIKKTNDDDVLDVRVLQLIQKSSKETDKFYRHVLQKDNSFLQDGMGNNIIFTDDIHKAFTFSTRWSAEQFNIDRDLNLTPKRVVQIITYKIKYYE